MGYGRLVRFGSTESLPSITDQPITAPNRHSHRHYLYIILLISAAALLIASAATTAVLLTHHSTTPSSLRHPTKAISRTCSLTRYPSLCINSLLDFPGAADAGESELVHISVNMTLRHVGVALYDAQPIANKDMDRLTRAAFEDCMELLDASSAHLARALEATKAGTAGDDVVTWLSAAVTDHDTCEEGLEGVEEGNAVKKDIKLRLRNLSELVSNCLAIVSLSSKTENGNRRRLLGVEKGGFPAWIGVEERRLLQAPPGTIQADYVVSKNGVGTYKTIEEAVKAAPENSGRRIVIHVKAGTYYENIKVGRKKTNLMFIGDGKGLTVVAGSRSVYEKYTTFHTATFAATGTGFIARDMSFENTAGPAKHQAVALRIGADHAVVYRCNIIGYQDTLYVHSQRQFFRECDVYGTVDFIFGNAAVVFQACNLYARKPMPNQKNTITAQNRKDPNQNTGISIHACKILPAGDLRPVTGSYPTYLGRPWKMYSRVVYMLSYMSDHVHPSGWLEWSGDFALRSLYYGEYMNNGPGAAIGKRVSWPGFRVITLAEEAGKFTVGQFIAGATWLPSTGVAFLQGLRG